MSTKLRNLSEVTVVDDTDILYTVVDPGGTPLDRKVTLSTLYTKIPGTPSGFVLGGGDSVNKTLTVSDNSSIDQDVSTQGMPTFSGEFITSDVTLIGDLYVDGDIYRTAWIDYSSSSTVNGWSSTTVKKIFYKRVGKLVFVQFDIRGTSDSSTTNFTLPYLMGTGVSLNSSTRIKDNGTFSNNPGLAFIDNGGARNLVQLFKDFSGNTFTASGAKEVYGQFWYEVI